MIDAASDRFAFDAALRAVTTVMAEEHDAVAQDAQPSVAGSSLARSGMAASRAHLRAVAADRRSISLGFEGAQDDHIFFR